MNETPDTVHGRLLEAVHLALHPRVPEPAQGEPTAARANGGCRDIPRFALRPEEAAAALGVSRDFSTNTSDTRCADCMEIARTPWDELS